MSITDQAFIRAFRDPAAAKLAAGSASASLQPEIKISKILPKIRAAGLKPATVDLTQSSESQSDSRGLVSNVIEAGPNGDWSTSFATIDVGLDSPVPPPHAAFKASVKSSDSPLATAARPKSKIGSRPVFPPVVRTPSPFGKSAKASLSSFTGSIASQVATESQRPALEVDAVRWPAICELLLKEHAEQFDQLADEARPECLDGRKVIGITGIDRGEGRTTLALCLARRLTSQNMQVAIVDADFASPSLAERLGLSVEQGWEAVLDGRESIWELMIESKADRLAVLPLAGPVAIDTVVGLQYRVAAAFQELSEHYDAIVVDAGPIAVESSNLNWLLQPNCGVSGLVVAHDVRRNEGTRLAAVCLQLAEANVTQLGIAEMFVNS